MKLLPPNFWNYTKYRLQ